MYASTQIGYPNQHRTDLSMFPPRYRRRLRTSRSFQHRIMNNDCDVTSIFRTQWQRMQQTIEPNDNTTAADRTQ